MSYLNLASVRPCTEAEGPGRRFALWVQGCERRCKGCCNPSMQEIKRNKIVAVEDLIKYIRQTKAQDNIEGLSFIGGEPFLQAAGLAELAEWAQSEGLSVLVFTGYLLEDLKNMNNASVDKLLSHTDLLVDGPFIEEQYDAERDWIGSANQKVWYLTGRYKKGIEYAKAEHQMEIMVSEKDILINGWPF